MTGLPTWAELTALLGVVGGGIGTLIKRESKRSSLTADISRMEEEATKALRSHEEAMETKNEELRLLREEMRYKEGRLEDTIASRDERIQELMDRLYMRGD